MQELSIYLSTRQSDIPIQVQDELGWTKPYVIIIKYYNNNDTY